MMRQQRTVHSLPLCALGQDDEEGVKNRTVLLVLNSELPSQFEVCWRNSRIRVCADGGANRVHDRSGGSLVPDAVCGDLDSVRPDVVDHFSGLGSLVVRDLNQDTDDLTKSIEFLRPRLSSDSRVIIVGGLGLNITQELANLNAFFLFPELDLFFLSDYNVIASLGPGGHTLVAPGRFGCGMMPLGSPCSRAVTTGLRWNVDGPLRYGGLISSSNEMTDTSVTVDVTDRILWTWDLKTKLI